MPQYANSRGIGYTAWSNPNWSGFMNSYAATPLNTGATSGMEGISFFGQWSITAPYSGTYTFRAAADDQGSVNFGGIGFSPSGFGGGGNSASKFYSQGQTIVMQWSIGNSSSAPGFVNNPCAVAWTLDGPGAPAKPSVSLSANPTAFIRGNCTTLSYSSSGVYLSSASSNFSGSPGYSGSVTVCPTSSTTYSYTVCNEGGCSTAFRAVTVYIPPVLYISANRLTLVAGQCSNVSWYITGDGSNVTWTDGTITNGNTTSSQTVCPQDTTRYAGYVSGLGGTSPETSITITVYQIPTIDEFEVPDSINYGEQGFITANYSYGNISATLSITYFYIDTDGNTQSIVKPPVILTPSGSAELTGTDKSITNTVDTNITYDDFGPRNIEWVLTVVGDGGTVTSTKTTIINIDELPDNLALLETPDKIRDQEPVYTPDIVPQDVIESDLYLIDGIDIPVEIKSDYPIQVDINQSGTWSNVRDIG